MMTHELLLDLPTYLNLSDEAGYNKKFEHLTKQQVINFDIQ